MDISYYGEKFYFIILMLYNKILYISLVNLAQLAHEHFSLHGIVLLFSRSNGMK